MDTVRTAEKNCYPTNLAVDSKLSDLSAFLSEWLEKNSDTISKQFSNAVSEVTRRDSNKDEVAHIFVSEMIKQGLVYVASAEKQKALQRQAEGIRAAKERGVHFGRQKKEIPAEFYPLYFRYKKGEFSARKCGEMLNVSHSTFLKWTKEVDEQVK